MYIESKEYTGEESNVNKTTGFKEKKMSRLVSFEDDQIGFEFSKVEREEIPLGDGNRIQVVLAEIDLSKLRLDRSNPRISFALRAKNKSNPSQEELEELLWEDDDVKALKRSIQGAGGLVEAIIVNGADCTVLEGNCRTVSILKLAAEFPDDPTWKKVRARIVPSGITRDQISLLLGELHVGGKNHWSAFEQAAHFYDMHVTKGFKLERLAEMYRMSKSTASAKIRAYRLMVENYMPQADATTSPINKWSYFEEFFKVCKPKLTEAGEELENRFVGWMLEDKFKKGAEVRYLKKILEDSDALNELEKNDAASAWAVVEQDSPELGSKLFKSIVAATKALKSAPLTEVDAVRDGDEARVRELREMKKALDSFAEQAGINL